MGRQWKQCQTLFWGATKSLLMVITAMKLKDTPWKESYDQPRQNIKKQRHYFANKSPSSQGYGFSSGHVWMWELDCKEMTHWKRPWCWEGLGAGEGDDRGWDGWMASLTQWTWVWVDSGSWWWTGRPGMLLFMGLQRVGHDWATELNWTEVIDGYCVEI